MGQSHESWHTLWSWTSKSFKFHTNPCYRSSSTVHVLVKCCCLDRNFGCVLWPWHWRYVLWSRSWHAFGSLTIIHMYTKKITKASSQVKLSVWNYYPCDTIFLLLSNVTLTFGISTSLNMITHLCIIMIIIHNCAKCNGNPSTGSRITIHNYLMTLN